jgi:hypothetical protein
VSPKSSSDAQGHVSQEFSDKTKTKEENLFSLKKKKVLIVVAHTCNPS